eukprot:TRINITY_DN4945_c0_g1_i2.p1 TRINITY_DN4945_c0_g1~~TRINITY_DN4945_c0_g1_i2.p1  ORF type:complete len:375 (-),score=30.85 TRINITY_DN4945_c0_g1_i2:223-1347(-)
MPAYHEILGPYKDCKDILLKQFKKHQQDRREVESDEFEIGGYKWKLQLSQCQNGDVSVHVELSDRVQPSTLRQQHLHVQDVRYVDLGVCLVAPLKTPKMMTLFGNDLKSNSKKWGWAKFIDKQTLFGDQNNEGWLGPHGSLRFRVWINYRPEEVPKKFTEFEIEKQPKLKPNRNASVRSITSVTSSEAESRVYLAHTARIVWDLLISVNVRKNPSYQLNQNKLFRGSCVETMFQLLCHLHNEEYEIKALWDVHGLAEVATKFHCRVKIHKKICNYIEQHQDDMLLSIEDIGDPCHIVQILELSDKHSWESIVALCEWKMYKYGCHLFQESYIMDLLPRKSKDRILYVVFNQIINGKKSLELSRTQFANILEDMK